MSNSLDLTTIPNGFLKKRSHILAEVLPSLAQTSEKWIQDEFGLRGRLEASLSFVSQDLTDAVRGDIESLDRVWYFPWNEAATELQLAVMQGLIGMYRATYDHQRRALELAVVGALFVAHNTPATAGTAWMRSEGDTPNFSRSLALLAKDGFVANVDAQTGWVSKVKAHYRSLCDVIHVRGQDFGSLEIQPAPLHFDGLPVPSFSAEALERSLRSFIATMEHIAVTLVLMNPVLIRGLPIDEKFGLFGPMSGFFVDEQSAALRHLIPEDMRETLARLAEVHPITTSLIADIEARPTLTREEMEKQVSEFHRLMGKIGRDNRRSPLDGSRTGEK